MGGASRHVMSHKLGGLLGDGEKQASPHHRPRNFERVGYLSAVQELEDRLRDIGLQVPFWEALAECLREDVDVELEPGWQKFLCPSVFATATTAQFAAQEGVGRRFAAESIVAQICREGGAHCSTAHRRTSFGGGCRRI